MVVPTPDGHINSWFWRRHSGGVHEIYHRGAAVAALLRHRDHPTVDKIVDRARICRGGKRRVFGVVGIDLIAGPSEILVVADAENDPDWIVIDLLSQAEHDTATVGIDPVVPPRRQCGRCDRTAAHRFAALFDRA